MTSRATAYPFFRLETEVALPNAPRRHALYLGREVGIVYLGRDVGVMFPPQLESENVPVPAAPSVPGDPGEPLVPGLPFDPDPGPP
jgi:hypothetical protein